MLIFYRHHFFVRNFIFLQYCKFNYVGDDDLGVPQVERKFTEAISREAVSFG